MTKTYNKIDENTIEIVERNRQTKQELIVLREALMDEWIKPIDEKLDLFK